MKFNSLTRLDIRRLKSGQHIAEHGIRFDRLANGDGRYTVEIMVDRVRVHRVVGLESNGVTRTQAEELISRLRTEAREQRLKLPAGRKVALTFAQAAVHYLKRSEEVQGKNLKAKQQHLTQHLVPFFGKLPLSKIDALGLKRYVKQRSEHIAASTINRELATLSNLLHRAIEWGWIEKAVKVPRLKENNGRMIYLTREQILRVLEAARADSCWEIHPFVLIGLHTGMRRMEILSMRWERIDYEHCIIRIPETKAWASRPADDGGASGLSGGTSGDGSRIALGVPRRQRKRASRGYRKAVPAGDRSGGPKQQGSHPPRIAAYRNHASGAIRCRFADRAADQRPQNASDGWPLQPPERRAFANGDGSVAVRDYTGITRKKKKPWRVILQGFDY